MRSTWSVISSRACMGMLLSLCQRLQQKSCPGALAQGPPTAALESPRAQWRQAGRLPAWPPCTPTVRQGRTAHGQRGRQQNSAGVRGIMLLMAPRRVPPAGSLWETPLLCVRHWQAVQGGHVGVLLQRARAAALQGLEEATHGRAGRLEGWPGAERGRLPPRAPPWGPSWGPLPTESTSPHSSSALIIIIFP